MSDEQPRMSRREMRAKGLLAPILDGASPIDDLTPTAEIRLKRLTRKEMRERDLAAEKAQLTGETSAVRPGVEAPSTSSTGTMGSVGTSDVSGATSRWQRSEGDSATVHASGPVTGTGRIASHAEFAPGHDSGEARGYTGNFERVSGASGENPALGHDGPGTGLGAGLGSETGSMQQTGIQHSGELNALGQSTTSWTPPESTSPVEASIMGGRIVGGTVIIDSPEEQGEGAFGDGTFGDGTGAFGEEDGPGEAPGFGEAPASFEEATGIGGVSAVKDGMASARNGIASAKNGLSAAKKIGGRFNSAKREADKAMEAGRRSVFGRFIPGGDSDGDDEGELPEGFDPQAFDPEGMTSETSFDLEASGVPEQAVEGEFFEQEVPEGFEMPGSDLTDGIPGFSDDDDDDDTSFDPTKALKTPLLKRLRGKGKKASNNDAAGVAAPAGQNGYPGGYPGAAHLGAVGHAGPAEHVGPAGVADTGGAADGFAPPSDVALADQDLPGQAPTGTVVDGPAIDQAPEGFAGAPGGMADVGHDAEHEAFAEEDKPRGRMVTLLLILLFMVVGAALGIVIRRYLLSEGDVVPALNAVATALRLPGI